MKPEDERGVFYAFMLAIMPCSLTVIITAKNSIKGDVECWDVSNNLMSLILGIIGVITLSVGMIGLRNTYRPKLLRLINLIVLLLCVLFLITVLAFWCFATIHDDERSTAARDALGEPSLRRYPQWLQQRHLDRWPSIKKCLLQTNFCHFPRRLFLPGIKMIEEHCCNPPKSCGLDKQVEGNNITSSSTLSKVADCRVWSDEGDKLCLECEVCKAGFLVNEEKDWRVLASNWLSYGLLATAAAFWAFFGYEERLPQPWPPLPPAQRHHIVYVRASAEHLPRTPNVAAAA